MPAQGCVSIEWCSIKYRYLLPRCASLISLLSSGVPRNLFRGGSTNSVEDRENGELRAVAP